MKKKIFFVLATAIMVTLLIPGINPAVGAITVNDVSIGEAQGVALNLVGKSADKFPEWVGATVSKPVTYYTPDSVESAYEFTVTKNGKEVGFVITSARKDWMPVLEFGNGNPPSRYISYAQQIAVDHHWLGEAAIVEPVIYYWGAFTYSVQFGNTMVSTNIVIHLPTGRIMELPQKCSLDMEAQSVQRAWMKQISGSRGLLSSSNSIYGVPAFFQSYGTHASCDEGGDGQAQYPNCVGDANDPWDNWDGCAPISGAMILGYWDYRGCFSISNDDEELIDRCHWEMSTSSGGWTLFSYAGMGLVEVFSLYGYTFYNTELEVSWNNIVNEINNSRPFHLCVNGNSTYGDHFVTGYGYYEDGDMDQYFILVRDTYDTSSHYVTFGDWDPDGAGIWQITN